MAAVVVVLLTASCDATGGQHVVLAEHKFDQKAHNSTACAQERFANLPPGMLGRVSWA